MLFGNNNNNNNNNAAPFAVGNASSGGNSLSFGNAGANNSQEPSNAGASAGMDVAKVLDGVARIAEEIDEINGFQQLLNSYVEFGAEYELEFKKRFEGRFMDIMQKPLSHEPRNAQHKAQIETLNRTKVDVVNVLRLADELDLDEKQALNLWTSVDSARARKSIEAKTGMSFGGGKEMDTYTCAVTLFFWKWDSLLGLLIQLLELGNATDAYNEDETMIRPLIRALVSGMLSKYDYCHVLMRLVGTVNQRIGLLLSPQFRGVQGRLIQLHGCQKQRGQLCQCLYLIFHDYFASEKESLELLKLIRTMSNRWMERQDVMENRSEVNTSYEATSLLILALGLVLDYSDALYDRVSNQRELRRITEAHHQWLQEMDTTFSEENSNNSNTTAVATTGNGFGNENTSPQMNWLHEGVFGCCLLFWGSFLVDLRPEDLPNSRIASDDHSLMVLKAGLQFRGVSFLRGMVRSPEFIYDEKLREVHIRTLTVLTERIMQRSAGMQQFSNGSSSINNSGAGGDMNEDVLLVPRYTYLQSWLERRGGTHQIGQGGYGGGSSGPGGYGSTQYGGVSGETRLISDKDAIPDCLEDFLGLLRLIHELEPKSIQGYWDQDDIKYRFLRSTRKLVDQSNDPHSLYIAFLEFLASLASTPTTSEEPNRNELALIHFLSQGDDDIKWSVFYAALTHYNDHLGKTKQAQQQQQMMMMPNQSDQTDLIPIPIQDQLVLCCWLRILSAALASSRCVRAFDERCTVLVANSTAAGSANTASSSVASICMSLVQYNLEPALKAQLTWVVSKMAPALQCDNDQKRWEVIEQEPNAIVVPQQHGFQIYQQPQLHQQQQQQRQQRLFLVECLRSDLYGNESSQHAYPFTCSFLDLVYSLVRVGDRKDNLITYLDFISEHIFLKLDQRKYKLPGEKWRIAASCLQIFSVILERYTSTSESGKGDFSIETDAVPYSAGFWVMTKLLEGGNFFKQMLDLIGEAGGESGVRTRRETLPKKGSSGEGALELLQQQQVQLLKQQEEQQKQGGGFLSLQQQQQFMLNQQLFQQQSNHEEGDGEQAWFVVAARRANMDLRNSSVVQGEPDIPDHGAGMIRIRNRVVAQNQECYDGGKFASWLAEPSSVYDWFQPVESEASNRVRFDRQRQQYPYQQQQQQYQQQQNYYQQQQQQYRNDPMYQQHLQTGGGLPIREGPHYTWDDGDTGGLWREHTVRLALRVLTAASARENWFFDGVRKTSADFESRLERLHRLFCHKRERLLLVAGFFQYPYSVEMRLNAIELLFRLSKEGPGGSSSSSVVEILRYGNTSIKESLGSCLVSPDVGEGVAVRLAPKMNPDGNDPILSSYDYQAEQISALKIQKRVLELLVEGLSKPRGSLTELVLGLAPFAAGEVDLQSINLGPNEPCALNVVLDILNDANHPWQGDDDLMELMYRLVFQLCDNRFTGLPMLYGLHMQRDKFWVRHFKETVSRSNMEIVHSKKTKSIAWVVSGVGIDLRVAYAGLLPDLSTSELLPTLFSVDSIRDVDQTHLRILEVLDTIPLQMEDLSIPDVFKHLEMFSQGGSLWKSFARSRGHTFFVVDIDEMKVVFDEWKRKTSSMIRSTSSSSYNQQGQQLVLQTETEWGHLKAWAESWNDSVETLSARAHVINAWKEIVKLSVVECREDLIRTCIPGRGDEQLLKHLCLSILRKLFRNPRAPSVLADPLASLVVILIGQLRFGDDSKVVGMDTANLAIAAATGCYCSSFSCSVGKRSSTGGEEGSIHHHGLARLSREENSQLLTDIMQSLRSSRAFRDVDVLFGVSDASPKLRASSLYTSLLLVIQGSRSLYADALDRMRLAGITSMNGQETPVGLAQIPRWISERTFLAVTENMPNDEVIQELRQRASGTLDILYGSERGSTLLEMAAVDAVDSEEIASRLTGLAMVKALLECDRDDRWHSALRRKGFFRHLMGRVIDRLRSDQLFASNQNDRIYELSVAVLCSMTLNSKDGAVSLVRSGFLASLQEQPLMILCDKRAIDSWVGGSANNQGDSGSSQEQRHDLVLPFLRLISSTFVALKKSNGNTNELLRFRKEVLRFLRVQKRMVTSALGFPPVSLDDIEESSLLLTILTHCASSNNANYVQELGAMASEFDSLVFDLIQEICCPQRGEWKDVIVPFSIPDQQRAEVSMSQPPDLAPNKISHGGSQSDSMVNLFQLDVFSQERLLLQNAIAYCRVRKEVSSSLLTTKENKGTTGNQAAVGEHTYDTYIQALVVCLDYCSRSLAAVARNSGSAFMQALSDKKHMMMGGGGASSSSMGTGGFHDPAGWSQHVSYVSWTISSLLFVLEGALCVLYYKLKSMRQIEGANMNNNNNKALTLYGNGTPSKGSNPGQAVHQWLRHSKLLVNHYDPSQEKSPLEQLEDVIRSNESCSQFIHLILRRMREL